MSLGKRLITLGGAAGPTPIDSGKCAVFNGTNAYVALSSTAFRYTTFSVTSWVKPDTVSSYLTVINNYESSGGAGGSPPNSGWNFRVNNNATISMMGYSTHVSGIVTSTTTISASIWTHIAAVITPSTWKVYINGVDGGGSGSATTTTIEYNSTGNNTCSIGRSDYVGGASQYFDGKMDDIRVYNDELTASEVAAIAQNNTGSIPSGNLQAYYKFDDNVDDTQGNYDGVNYNVTFADDPAKVNDA